MFTKNSVVGVFFGASLMALAWGAPSWGAVKVSDSFNRADADRCFLGAADHALGGSGTHYYLPIFFTGTTANPIGANISSSTLLNNGLDFGGVQLTSHFDACASTARRGENLGQDLNVRASLLVPTDASLNITGAGLYFRGRAAARGDGIFGGSNTGYAVQLFSTGLVRVVRMAGGIEATAGCPATFDPTIYHTLEIAGSGTGLQVSLDGKLLTFDQSSVLTTTVTISSAATSGTVGILFSAEDNRGSAGGQRADDLVVSDFASLSALPVQNNFLNGGGACGPPVPVELSQFRID